jgi:predicted ATPase/DNA-binding SARP family transcriptional activator
MVDLALYVLGPPQVTLDGKPVHIGRRKAVALLAYLAVTRQPHTREALATMFWPEAGQSRALAYLRTTLWALNKALGDVWLDTEGETVEVAPGAALWLDVARFHALVAEAPLSDPARCTAVLSEAVDLYRDQFLAGFTLPDCPAFDEWQFFQGQALEGESAAALEQLVNCCVALGSFADAIPHARRRLAMDPLHEPAHRQLMQLYDWAGQRSAALRQYEECAAVLQAELGVEPGPDTTALNDAIRERRAPAPPTVAQHTSLRQDVPAKVQASKGYLPLMSTPFVGREDEIREITQRLADPACRLMTLAGPGGIGKTRLALKVATETSFNYQDGAYFVSLAPVESAEYLVPAVADAVRFTFREQGDPKSQLLAYLGEKHMLLVMDNFEHLLDGVDLVSEILATAPQVKVLATSREHLHLHEEWVYETRGLTYPRDGAAGSLEAYGAVQLFVQSAQRVRPGFTLTPGDWPHVTRICRLVEGMPLGVELAAAWMEVLSPKGIADEIARSIDFLNTSARNLPLRHRSVRAVFESSWERLSPEEQDALSKLSILRSGFQREAAEVVAGATLPLMRALVNKSLVRRNVFERYEIHELLRQFTEDKLNATPDIRDHTRDRHAAYYAGYMQRQTAVLKSARQIEALDEIEAEIDNIRAAWIWAVHTRNTGATRGLLGGLAHFYLMRTRLQEAKELFGGTIIYLEAADLSEAEQIILAQIKILQAFKLREYGLAAEVVSLYRDAVRHIEAIRDENAVIFLIMLSSLASWPAYDL